MLHRLKPGSRFSRQLHTLPIAVLFALPACQRRDKPPPPPPRVNYTVQIQKAQEAYLTADYRQALSAFELILSREFDSRMKAEPAYWSGLCHLKFGSYIKAEQRFQQAVKDLTVGYLIGPALVGLADSQRMLGKKVEARANYNRALGSFETFIEVSKVRARLALVGGESVVVTRPPKNLSPIDPAPTTSILPKGSFSLQTGAFHDRAVAMQLVNKLKTLGHPPFLHRENREGKLMYKVRVGIYRNKAEAQKVQQQLKARGFDSFIVQ